ncbi:MAG: single-stranded-DNA-specific exonuclease RecJ [Clostridiales bacterium]|nr:single-stranded-DNA-specific exonuclease RecJ [Clostridiales bacterium]
MNKWFLYTKRADFAAIGKRFGIDAVTARVIRNRDIVEDGDIDMLLNGGTEMLYDERLLPDIEEAADILAEAVKKKERIRIVGDYDIDGVCSTYILLMSLRKAGAQADARIPDRIRDGYGINSKIVEEAIDDGTDIILTCDNGIAAIEELAAAKKSGLRVIVTDHHSIRQREDGSELLPEADAVVDVKRKDSRYPTQEICGAVIAWKLIKRLGEKLGADRDEWLSLLEFAAVATVGDIMPLTGENRIIVREGLKRLNSAEGPVNLGLGVLTESLGLKGKAIDTYHIGFVIGPCINAGGRLESADIALRLFLSEDKAEAEVLSRKLIQLNEERRQMTEKGVSDGIEIIEGYCSEDKVLVVYLPGLHESLAGIVAGRLKEKYYRPCIVVTDAVNGLKGSGRSIESYDMFEGLCRASSHLTKFGGHRMAAGLSLSPGELEPLRRELNDNSGLESEDFVKKIWIDAAMPPAYVSERLINELEMLGPFGPGFERPLFACKSIRVLEKRVLGKHRNALKLRIADGYGRCFDGIMFGDADELIKTIPCDTECSVLYYPKINEYGGRKSIQLEIREFSK